MNIENIKTSLNDITSQFNEFCDEQTLVGLLESLEPLSMELDAIDISDESEFQQVLDELDNLRDSLNDAIAETYKDDDFDDYDDEYYDDED